MQTRPTLVPRETEKYDTANCSLRQGDEEIKKEKNKNIYILTNLPNISVWKQIFLRG